MIKFKKGDWVVFTNFNNYPVELESDAKFGYLSESFGDSMFFEMSKEDGEKFGIEVGYCVQDPRITEVYGLKFGYCSVHSVRFAEKKDFEDLIKSMNKQAKEISKVLKHYAKIRNKL